MNSRIKWSIALAVVVAAAVAAHRLTFSRHSPASASDPPYREVVAKRGSFRLVVTANGLVRPIDRIEIKSKASGEVIELPIEAVKSRANSRPNLTGNGQSALRVWYHVVRRSRR